MKFNRRILESMLWRYALLIPMAFCIYLIIVSQDQNVRLVSVVILALLEQIRVVSIAATAKAFSKDK